MDLSQLKYFQKVARTENLTQAALQLNISQPTLSQSLRRLEASLGCPLFVHTPGKRLQLNDAGHAFLEYVDRLFIDLEEGVQHVHALQDRSSNRVSVVSSISDMCCELVMSYYEKNPGVTLTQRLTEINSLSDLLLSETADFALSPCPLDEAEPRVESIPLFTEELFVITGPQHPLFGRTAISVEELMKQRFILNFAEADINYLYMLFGDEACNADILLQSNEGELVRRMLEQNEAVSFLSARMVMRRMEQGDPLVQRPIRVTDYHHGTPTCITVKRGRKLTGTAKEFYQFVINYCEEERQLLDYFMQRHFPD